MKHSSANTSNGLSTVDKDKDAPIGKSYPLWNNPARSGYTRDNGVREYFYHRRTHYPIERRSDNLFNRILRKIGLG